MAKYAIIESGGKQYHAEEGHTLYVDKLASAIGEQIMLDRVLLLADEGQVEVGAPTVTGAQVKATVLKQERGPKILVFKYRPKKRYRSKQGHRQSYTQIRIDSIGKE